MDELFAVQFCQTHPGRIVLPDGRAGRLQVLEDMNCCAPTNAVLFAFVEDSGRRQVFDGQGLLDFVKAYGLD